MNYKKLIIIGDANFRGDGAEWPDLYKFIGPVPLEYRGNIWSTKIKKALPPELVGLHKEFYSALQEKVIKNKDKVLEIRKEKSFGSILAKELGLEYENYACGSTKINEILPFFKYHCNESNFKDTLVLAGIPPALENLTYNQNGDKLKNISIDHIASHIMLIKEYVENRGGHFMYMHTEDFPEQLYDPEHNPYLFDLMLLLLHKGNIQSLLTNAYYWRKFDGKFYDAAAQKNLAQSVAKLVVSLQ